MNGSHVEYYESGSPTCCSISNAPFTQLWDVLVCVLTSWNSAFFWLCQKEKHQLVTLCINLFRDQFLTVFAHLAYSTSLYQFCVCNKFFDKNNFPNQNPPT